MAADQPLEDVPVVSDPLELFLDEQQRVIIGRGGDLHSEFPNEGMAFIGRVFEQGSEGPTEYTLKPVFLDIAQPHRIFISGKSGSGKSYTLGAIVEEIQKAQMGVSCVVVDIMGVFTASKEANHEQKEMESLLQWNLTPEGVQNVKIFVPDGVTGQIPKDLWDEAFSFKPEDLEIDDWLYVFDINFNTAMGLCLSEVMNLLRQERPEGYSIGDMVTAIQTAPQITDPEKGFAVSSRKALSSKLQAAQHWGIFSAHGTPMSAICQPNTCSILDVSPLNDSLRALVTGILARKILETRRQIARGGEIVAEDAIPITWLIVDEAHNFAPSRGTTPALEALVRLAKEGRHPGANLVLATQQPGATSNEIISQCDILITHNLSYDEDIKIFKAKAPCEIPKSIADSRFIRGLPVGVGILAAQSMKISRAFVVQIRPRQAQHGGKEMLPAGLVGPQTDVPSKAAPEEGVDGPEQAGETSMEPEDHVPFKNATEFFPPDQAPSVPPTSSPCPPCETPGLTGSATLNLPEDLAIDVLDRALTYDPFFPKTGPFDEETGKYCATPEAFISKATEILQKANYIVKYKTHESGAWLLLGEHTEAEHAIFFAAAMVETQLVVEFQATIPSRNPPLGVTSLKKFVSMLGTCI